MPQCMKLTRLASALAVAGAGALAGSAIAPSMAQAGAMTQVICTAPNGQPAPTEGVTNSAAGGGTTTNACNPYAGGLIAALSSSAAVPAGGNATLTYNAPAGSTILGGTVSLSLFSPSGRAYVSNPTPSDVIAYCAAGSPCGGSVGGELTQAFALHSGGTHIYAVADCPSGCQAGGGGAGLDAQVNVYAMSVQLGNNATPTGTGFGGSLLVPGAVHGTQPVTFTAADPGGPGVQKVVLAVDGRTLYTATPDNPGRCASIGNDASGYPEYPYAMPCPATFDASIPVDSTLFPDGSHALTITVSDAAHNSAVVLTRTLTISNAPGTAPGTGTGPSPSNPATSNTPQPTTPSGHPAPACTVKPKLSLRARALGHARLRFTGTLRSPGCTLGDARMRPLILIEAHNARLHHWQAIGATARVHPSGAFTVTYQTDPRAVGGTFNFRGVAPSTSQFGRVVSPTTRVKVH